VSEDAYSWLVMATQALAERLGTTDQAYAQLSVLWTSLSENLEQARLLGDTPERRSDRRRIHLALERISLKALGRSLEDLVPRRPGPPEILHTHAQDEAAIPAVPALDPSLLPEMMAIPVGDFRMGSDAALDHAASDLERPQHNLYLPSYLLSRTPVTNAQYALFVQDTSRSPPGRWAGPNPPRALENHPVVHVSWYDAAAYCRWLTDIAGEPYCLPSEAEWEKGARGTDGRIYPWGDRWEPHRCNSLEADRRGTSPVGALRAGASPYGLLDMAGNVAEWTRSLYRGYPYQPDDGREDAPYEHDRVVLRGGSFAVSCEHVRAAARDHAGPDIATHAQGFRVAKRAI